MSGLPLRLKRVIKNEGVISKITLTKKIFYTLISFLVSIIFVCVANYLFQILVIFLDIVTRLSSSSAYIIVLWIVTGAFAAVFTISGVEYLIGKNHFSYKLTGNIILILSLLMISAATILLVNGHFKRNPSEFSLLLSNGYVFISFFSGAGIMAAILRNLDK